MARTPRLFTTALGFTLIELSIVLVIIGLIVGGVLAGQSLIAAAAVRAQITEIEKFNTATATFLGKYGYLPGDLPPAAANQFGFPAGNGAAGNGNGDGILSGAWGAWGHAVGYGETAVFWADLGQAGLIEGAFSSDSMTIGPDVSGNSIGQYLPKAKIGYNNYVYVWSFGTCIPSCYTGTGPNYFGISQVSLIANTSNTGKPTSSQGITVQQAYSIDKKVDDGMPTSGRVIAAYVSGDPIWSDGMTDILYQALPSGPAAGSSGTCFDDGNNTTNPMAYSLTQNNGAGVNCALSFQFQAGD